jgi:methionyl-tRNA synthetase
MTSDDQATLMDLIEIEQFARVELRIGKILTCERLEKSKKLLRMTIDLAEETPRQILAGLAPWYLPEEMVGRRVVVVANLKPAKLMGHESQGMILAAGGGEPGNVPCLLSVGEGVPLGSRIR